MYINIYKYKSRELNDKNKIIEINVDTEVVYFFCCNQYIHCQFTFHSQYTYTSLSCHS